MVYETNGTQNQVKQIDIIPPLPFSRCPLSHWFGVGLWPVLCLAKELVRPRRTDPGRESINISSAAHHLNRSRAQVNTK